MGPDDETRCQRALRLLLHGVRVFVTFLFSHVGLACTVVAYTIAGGLVFMELEGPNETEVRQLMDQTKADFTDRLATLVNASEWELMDKGSWLGRVETLLQQYEREIHRATREKNWDGTFGDEEAQWSFAGALLFSVTVVTTIGYGHIAPKTGWGKIVTILYAILGIPMTMLCLRNIGNLMARCFRLVYRQVCVNLTFHYIMLRRRRMKQRFAEHLQRRKKKIQQWAKKNSLVPSVFRSEKRHSCQTVGSDAEPNGADEILDRLGSKRRDRSQSEGLIWNSAKDKVGARKYSLSVDRSMQSGHKSPDMAGKIGNVRQSSLLNRQLHSFETRSDIPYIDENASISRKSNLLSVQHPTRHVVKGLPEMPVLVESIDESDDDQIVVYKSDRSLKTEGRNSGLNDEIQGVDIEKPSSSRRSSECIRSVSEISPHSPSGSSLSLNDFDEDALIMKERLKHTRDMVPISVCILLMTGYIILGAVMFTLWEEDWDFVEGTYFCFITLTTIGFGDFVPGTGASNWANQEKLVLCILYLVFGMAMIAMAFHLIQEEVSHKFKKLALKIGLLEEKITQALDNFTA